MHFINIGKPVLQLLLFCYLNTLALTLPVQEQCPFCLIFIHPSLVPCDKFLVSSLCGRDCNLPPAITEQEGALQLTSKHCNINTLITKEFCTPLRSWFL